MRTLDLSHPNILKLFGRHTMKADTESRSFLVWFLENYYHLDEQEAYDSICDRPNDKGIDGIYVNDFTQQIDFFQATISRPKASGTEKQLGDTDLKEFVGSVGQFTSKESIQAVVDSK